MTVEVVRFTVRGEAQEPFAATRPYVAIYDGNCRVCTRLANLLRKWDSKQQIEVVPSQRAGIVEAFPFISAEDYRLALQLVGPGNQRWQGADAIDQILRLLPHGWLLGWTFRLPFAGRAADRFYRWFARNRYRFGCGEHCKAN